MWTRIGCKDCNVELDEGQPMKTYPTHCFKCGNLLIKLD